MSLPPSPFSYFFQCGGANRVATVNYETRLDSRFKSKPICRAFLVLRLLQLAFLALGSDSRCLIPYHHRRAFSRYSPPWPSLRKRRLSRLPRSRKRRWRISTALCAVCCLADQGGGWLMDVIENLWRWRLIWMVWTFGTCPKRPKYLSCPQERLAAQKERQRDFACSVVRARDKRSLVSEHPLQSEKVLYLFEDEQDLT